MKRKVVRRNRNRKYVGIGPLVEPGYLTNKAEERLAFSQAFQSEVASDILRGVTEYFRAVDRYKRGLK
jgi:N-acetylmuramoyl-L-alanine amidase